MTNKEIIQAVNKSIQNGKSKQETFDALKDRCKIPLEKLAKIIKPFYTLRAKTKYKKLNRILLIFFTIMVLLQFFSLISIIIENGFFALLINWYSTFLTLFNVYVLFEIAKCNSGSHRLVVLATAFLLLLLIGNIIIEPFEPIILIDIVLVVINFGLGFYLYINFCPEYAATKERYQNSQGQIKLRDSYKFAD